MDSPVEMEAYGLNVTVPDSVAGRERAEEGIEVLVKAAMPHYNRAVRLIQSGEVDQSRQVGEALQAIRSALRLFPYSRKFVDLGLTLSIQHGDFRLAKRLLRLADKLGIDEDLPEYRNALEEAISDWNRFLEDTTALREKYQDETASQSYRELLLLAERVDSREPDPLSDREQSHLEDLGVSSTEVIEDPPPSNGWISEIQKRAVLLGVVGTLGLAVGFAASFTTGDQDGGVAPTEETATSDTTTDSTLVRADSILRQVAIANRNLAEGKPLAAAKIQDSLSAPENLSATSAAEKVRVASRPLQPVIDQALYEKAAREWEQGNFDGVVDLLAEIDSNEVGTERERLYMLGISAHKAGRPEHAKESLQKLLEGPFDLEDHPHYEAQAAYVLVQLLSEDESRKYVRLISEKYSDTIYYNSIVRSFI